MTKTLEGRVALVTGGARGIGKAICERLAKEGAAVVMVDIMQEVAEATAAEFQANGYDAMALAANVAKMEDAEAAVKATLDKYGKLDILVNCAGITKDNSTFQNVTLGDGADNVANGVMTAATAFAGIPVGAQLNASVTKDCVWLGFTDAELDAILAANPSYYKTVIPAGTYNGQDADVPTFGVKCMVICSEDMDEELVYNLAKTLAENTEEMIAGNSVFAGMADPSFICNDLPIPLHDGAAAYYGDAGMLK